jgi:hypothetical protein
MKKIAFMLLAVAVFSSCNNSSDDTVENKIDSLNERKDTLLNNVDSAFDKKIDSLEKRKEELKDKFDSTIDKKKDSLKGKKG